MFHHHVDPRIFSKTVLSWWYPQMQVLPKVWRKMWVIICSLLTLNLLYTSSVTFLDFLRPSSVGSLSVLAACYLPHSAISWDHRWGADQVQWSHSLAKYTLDKLGTLQTQYYYQRGQRSKEPVVSLGRLDEQPQQTPWSEAHSLGGAHTMPAEQVKGLQPLHALVLYMGVGTSSLNTHPLTWLGKEGWRAGRRKETSPCGQPACGTPQGWVPENLGKWAQSASHPDGR